MWQGDNCHTFDRDNYYAQQTCGVGQNKGILKNAVNYDFQVKYYPYLQTEKSRTCMSNFIADSPARLISEDSATKLLVAGLTLIGA